MLARADSAKTTLCFQPGQVWSLWDMIELIMGDVIDANNSVTMITQALHTLDAVGGNKRGTLGVENLAPLLEASSIIKKLSKDADLDSTEAGAERLEDFLKSLRARHKQMQGGNLTLSDGEVNLLQTLVTQLKVSFADQTRKRFALLLSAHEQRLFLAKEPPFGKRVFGKFNDSARDIVEAAKCLALHRNTASVFHLMLAMERALRKLADTIHVSIHDKNGQFERWGVIVGNIKAKIPSLPADQQADWTQAHNLLWGVGKVWRNETMHPADAYTDSEAGDVFDAVRVFMRHLATLV